jgi:cobalt-zinc-cadmium efflux system outer membrane protein
MPPRSGPPRTVRAVVAAAVLTFACESGVRAEEPPAAPRPMTLDDLRQIAVQNNPTLVQAAARVEAARGRAIQSGLYPNPTVAYDAQDIGARGTAGQHGAFVEQLVITGGKLNLNRAKFEQEVVQGEALALAQQYRVLNGVTLRYYQVLGLGTLYATRLQQAQKADEIVRAVEEMEKQGHAKRADVLEARAESRKAHSEAADARERYAAGWRDLTMFVGRPDLPPAPIAGSIEQGCEPLEWEPQLARLLSESPLVHAARAEVERNRFALRRELAEPIPNVQVRTGAYYDFDVQQAVGTVRFGVRLPVWDKNQGNIRTAQADLMRAEAGLTRLELALRQQLSQTFARYRSNQTKAVEYREHVLPEAREVLDLRLAGFKKKEGEYSGVKRAQEDASRAATEYLNAVVEVRRAEVYICGLLLVDGLEEPEGPPSDPKPQRNERVRPPHELREPISGGEGREPGQRTGNSPGLHGPPQ